MEGLTLFILYLKGEASTFSYTLGGGVNTFLLGKNDFGQFFFVIALSWFPGVVLQNACLLFANYCHHADYRVSS